MFFARAIIVACVKETCNGCLSAASCRNTSSRNLHHRAPRVFAIPPREGRVNEYAGRNPGIRPVNPFFKGKLKNLFPLETGNTHSISTELVKKNLESVGCSREPFIRRMRRWYL